MVVRTDRGPVQPVRACRQRGSTAPTVTTYASVLWKPPALLDLFMRTGAPGHGRPLNEPHPPTQRTTPAHSTNHTRPLNEPRAPTQRVGGAPCAGLPGRGGGSRAR